MREIVLIVCAFFFSTFVILYYTILFGVIDVIMLFISKYLWDELFVLWLRSKVLRTINRNQITKYKLIKLITKFRTNIKLITN
jgi:hypothetical protein